ncbi:MAG: hypothetical protein ACTHMB_16345, partial [Candidatus Binatia bacterium]
MSFVLPHFVDAVVLPLYSDNGTIRQSAARLVYTGVHVDVRRDSFILERQRFVFVRFSFRNHRSFLE